MNNMLINNWFAAAFSVVRFYRMTSFPILCFLFSIPFFLLSCGKEEPRDTLPFAEVHFRVNLHIHNSLQNPLSYKIVTNRILETDRIGYGGLLIVSGFNSEIFAYDLACPVERNRNIRVVPTDNGTAVCPVCHSVFNTSLGLGSPVSGVARVALQRYRVVRQNEGEYLIMRFF